MRYYHPRRSFTLIELIIVMVIVGILVAVSIPNISVFSLIKFSSAGKKVLADIRYAQSMALSRHSYTALQFVNNTEKYNGYICTAANCVPMSSYVSNWAVLADPLSGGQAGVSFASDSQYRGVDVYNAAVGNGNSVIFDPTGSPLDMDGSSLTSNGLITLRYAGEEIVFNITPRTGKVYAQQSF